MLDTQFNYVARQIFVTQPRNTGGGILAFLLSLDSNTASLNFKKQSLEKKLADWNNFVIQKKGNAHVHGFNNINQKKYQEDFHRAETCGQYIHKHHFYELFEDVNSDASLLSKMINKHSIGIYLTESCVERLIALRPQTPAIDYYQLWMYANQKKLLKDFFAIDCRHTLPFSDMLNIDQFIDHLCYCKSIFDLDTDCTIYQKVITQWYDIIK